MNIYVVSGSTAHYPREVLGYFESREDAISFAENHGWYGSFDVEEVKLTASSKKAEQIGLKFTTRPVNMPSTLDCVGVSGGKISFLK